MRRLILLIFLFFVSPALAQYWGYYENARFAYAIDVPPFFEGNGESANGGGQMFYNLAAEQGVSVWGGYLPGSLADEADGLAENLSGQGWAIGEQSSTPQWATLTARRDHRFIVQRLILLCDGASFAAFRAEFNIADSNAMDGVLHGLSRSFLPVGC